MVTQRSWSPGPEHWASELGDLRVLRPTPRVTLFIHGGHLEAGFAPPIWEAMEASLASTPGQLFIFMDGDRLETYDPMIRVITTEWISAHRDEIAALHVLARSRLTRMAVSVTSLMLGRLIVGHLQRDSFEAALTDAIERTQHGRAASASASA